MRPGRTSRAVRGSGRPTARLPYSRRLSPRTNHRTNPETRSRAKCAPLPDRYSVLNRKAPHLPVLLAGPDPHSHQMDPPAASRAAAARDQSNHRSRPGWRTWWTMCARSPRATALVPRSRPGWRTWWTMCARSPRATALVPRSRRGRYGTPPVCRCAPSGLRLAAPVRCPALRCRRVGADGQGPLGGQEPTGPDSAKPLGEHRAIEARSAQVISGQVSHQARHLPGPP